ncbi:MAG TPA: DUF177 domain-containing protein [Thermoanaerobaculia bacterium]
MRLRLDSARAADFSWEELVALEAADLGGEPTVVAVRGRLTPPEPEQWLDLDLAYRVVQPCDRCTRPVATEVRSAARLLVVRRRAARENGEVQLSADDLGLVEVGGHELDTTPLVVEQVQLELPTKPLCREDCRGLCPICGGDRNERNCTCENEASDPRWSALAELKGRLRAPD